MAEKLDGTLSELFAEKLAIEQSMRDLADDINHMKRIAKRGKAIKQYCDAAKSRLEILLREDERDRIAVLNAIDAKQKKLI